EANNTAYMVMRFEEGEDLATLLDRRGTLPQAQLVECLLPVLEGLQLIHASGFIHRDIKPENIYIRHDNSPVLLDFGSARQSFGSAKTMTILVAPGYAPLEQYYGDAKTQGPWTDIYGLGATCYRAIAGRAPLDAVARAKGVLGSTRDILQSAAELGAGRYGDRLLAAVDHALQLSERNRPQGVAEWKKELLDEAVGQPHAAEAEKRAPAVDPAASPLSVINSPRSAVPKTRVALAWGSLVVIATLLVGAYVGSMMKSAPAAVGSTSPLSSHDESAPSARISAPVAVLPDADAASVAPILQARPASASPAVAAPVVTAPPAAPAPLPSPTLVTRSIAPEPRRTEARVGVADSQRTLARAAPLAGAPANPATTPLVTPTVAPRSESTSSAPPSVPSTAVVATAASATPALTARRSREDQAIEAAEAALRRGDAAAASQILAPMAAAGIARAQALLARAREVRTSEQHSDFEAYVWYSIAARNGEPGAGAARDKLTPRLQPAELRQAAQIVERWKPTLDGKAGGEGTPP
ncbi:MAG: protein kinase, partial [Caldimonas sp.]